jgi:predicted type IV restriction endonuclease
MKRDPKDLLKDVSALRLADANEATTRLKLIDEILFDVLGWTKDDVEVEERVTEDGKTQFIDYLCRTAQTSLLIEAKRISVDFGRLPDVRRSVLKGSWLKGEAKEAVYQARDYGRRKGVGFCAATNGEAWIVFPINRRDAVSFEESSCIIFNTSVSTLDYDFEEFKGILSRESVIDNALERALFRWRVRSV